MNQDRILIHLNNASFKYQTGDYLFENIKITVKEGDKTAIVGANGSGKSTLLKILSGKIKVDEGVQQVNCKAFYVPQISLTDQASEKRIYEYISEQYEEWWDVLPELEKQFHLTFDTEALLKTLSGGELVKLNLAIAIKHKPDVLLLDEPTNHLDVKSINSLIKFINESKYTYVVVSHDIFFLDNVINNVIELADKKVTLYGGNYTFYKEQKELHLRGVKKQYELAREKLERAHDLAQKEIEKQAKRANEAKRAFIKGSIDKTEYNEGKNAASATQFGKAKTLEKLIESAEEKLTDYEEEQRRLAFISMKNTTGNIGRTLFELKNCDLLIDKKVLLKKINLKLTYGDRVVLSGDNGSGKSSLIKALVQIQGYTFKGDFYKGENLKWVYVDQNYSLIKPNLTLLDNLMAYDKELTESRAKEQLGKFQFKSEQEMKKLGSQLSGGEMVRLVLAMITSFPIDMIILDEPTNNLDVETIDVLIKALNLFKGAVIVVSHNIDFLNKINISTAYMIKKGELKLMHVEPDKKDEFFKALLA